MYKPMDKEIILCKCGSVDHLMVVFFEEDEVSPTVYCQIHLNSKPWYERLVYGIKYIFGAQSRYGAFEEFIFDPKDKEKIENIAKYLGK